MIVHILHPSAARRWQLLPALCIAAFLLVNAGASPKLSILKYLMFHGSNLHQAPSSWKNHSDHATPLIKPNLHFLPPDESKRILLVSYPGSGNTWLRHLIETGTRVYTGSIYKDPALFKEFRAENVADTSVIAIKDHDPCNDCAAYTESMTIGQKRQFRSVRVCEFCSAVNFRFPGKLNNVSDVKPGFFLHLIRNPFPSIIAYYQFWFVFLFPSRIGKN